MVVSSIPGRRTVGRLVVGTGMGDRLRAVIPSRYVTSHPSQLSLLPSVGREEEYRPRCGDALRLGSKCRMTHCIKFVTFSFFPFHFVVTGLFLVNKDIHLWINKWVAGINCVIPR